MCTVLLLFRAHPELPLVVAANRDEFHERPSAPPGPLGDGLLGPRDLRGGGTWMATNRHGVMASLTNAVPPDRTPVEGVASRGEVVGQALAARSARHAASIVAAIPPGHTRPFYLLVADAEEAFAVAPGRDGMAVAEVAPGIHVQENRPLDHPGAEKVVRARTLLEGWASWPRSEVLPRLRGVLSDHEPDMPALRQICVHTDGYGTRSSSILIAEGARFRWWYLEGHPCEGEFGEVIP